MSAPQARSTAQLNATWAARLLDTLSGLGVSRAVVSPGSRNTPLVLALAQRARWQVDVVLDERAAGFIALGHGLATGRPTVLVATSGTAGANYLPAFIEASQARVPLVVITADRPPELHGLGANQTTPQTGLFASHARLCFNLGAAHADTDPRWLDRVAVKAMAAATGRPAGPVHLNAPFREPLWERGVECPPAPAAVPTLMGGPAVLGDDAVSGLANRLAVHRNGLIVCGPSSSANPLPAEQIAALSRALRWPVLADPLSGLRHGSHDRSGVISHYDAILRAADTRLSHPTAVMHFGRPVTSKATLEWLAAGAPELFVAVDPDARLDDPSLAATCHVVADPLTLCGSLVARLAAPEPSSWWTHWTGAEAAAAPLVSAHCGHDDWEGHVARRIVTSMPDGSALFVGNSMPIRDLDFFGGQSARAVKVVANRGSSGIDGLLSTSLGLAAAWPGPVAGLIGDLSFVHDLDGLGAASGLEVRLTVIVINNGGGGIFGFLPIAQHEQAFERFFLTPQSVDIGAACKAAGARHHAIRGGADLEVTFRAVLERPGLDVIEVTIDRTRNVRRHREAFKAVAEAVLAAPGEARP